MGSRVRVWKKASISAICTPLGKSLFCRAKSECLQWKTFDQECPSTQGHKVDPAVVFYDYANSSAVMEAHKGSVSKCLSTVKLPASTIDTLTRAGWVFDYCTKQLRLPRLDGRPPVVAVAFGDRANDVTVPETGDN